MPITECGFSSAPSGTSPRQLLIHFGPTLAVDIGFDPQHQYPGNPQLPHSAATQVPALVDTGATESCIDAALAHQLQLPKVDEQQVSGVGGVHKVDMFLAHIAVPALQFVQYGLFAGVSLHAGGQAHQALIGRTFLQDVMLIYDGRTGYVQMAK